MSIFGSLFTAVSGMSAQSQSLSMISDNIANASTTGYKRNDAAFSTLVTNSGSSTLYSSGGVNARANARVSLQGILQQSASSTDVSISGNGMFVVRSSTTDPNAETLYTRAGSFSPDANGQLKNTAGYYLYGWAVNPDGSPIGTQNAGSLVPIDLSTLGSSSQATTAAGLKANLDASATATAYPVAAGTAASWSHDITVYDSLGTAQTLTANFTKTESPTAQTTSTGVDLINAYPAGGGDVSVGGHTVALGTNVNDLIANINATGDVYANLNADGTLNVKMRATGAGLALADGTATVASLGLAAGTTAAPAAPTALAATTATPNTEGWWQVSFVDANGLPVGTPSSGYINFNGDGSLNAAPDANGDVNVPLAGINWGNGSAAQSIDYDLAGLTQQSNSFTFGSDNQDGIGTGTLTGITFSEDGSVNAQYSNGLSTKAYQLAIGTFPNVDGLEAVSGNVYRVTNTSGNPSLGAANTGGAGTVEGGELEASNVDIADEFSKMIVTQRAYTANTKVISTADQMTQDLLQLR
jgi:flagellar hook protein FlgE